MAEIERKKFQKPSQDTDNSSKKVNLEYKIIFEKETFV
jgi:hypothetical protein